MVIRVYISGNSGNKEIVTHQQRIFMILNSLAIACEPVDIAGPGMDQDRDFMRAEAKKREQDQRHVLPPQIFNDDKYCGDYDDFDLANEDDVLEEFLGIPRKTPKEPPPATAAATQEETPDPTPDPAPAAIDATDSAKEEPTEIEAASEAVSEVPAPAGKEEPEEAEESEPAPETEAHEAPDLEAAAEE